MWLYAFMAANLLIVATCMWAVLSPRINDGLFGKIALIFLCLSSLTCAGWAWRYPQTVDRSEVVMSIAVACMAVRCFWIKRFRATMRRWWRR